MKEITRSGLISNLQFMALFIAIFESLEDYIIMCPRSLFNTDSRFLKCTENEAIIKKTEEKFRQKKETAVKTLAEAANNGDEIEPQKLEKLKIHAKYDYIKFIEDGYIQWLSPEYDAIIKKRLLTIDGKAQKKPNKTLNSVMFFVDRHAISEDDFYMFIKIRNRRNKFAHEMAELLITNVVDDGAQALFDSLINLYMRVNNYWSREFELSIGGDDIPTDVAVDFESVISTKLYNLFLAIDIMQGKHFVIDKKWQLFVGLYESLMIPIKEDNPNE